ncbi:MAG: hypothetical protein U5K37_12910 [Natrialbaceae archaeon]|nr:hypothetical protein [Natrialbaceae archaeon]
MSVVEHPSDDVLKFREPAALEGGLPEARLKRRLGRGIYVQEVTEQPTGDLVVVLGNATPRGSQ